MLTVGSTYRRHKVLCEVARKQKAAGMERLNYRKFSVRRNKVSMPGRRRPRRAAGAQQGAAGATESPAAVGAAEAAALAWLSPWGRGTPRPAPRTDCELSRLLATFPLPLSVKTLPRSLLPRTLRGSKSSPWSWPRPITSVLVPRPANHRGVLRPRLTSALLLCGALESLLMAWAATRAAYFPRLTLPLFRSSLPAVVLSYPSPAQSARQWRCPETELFEATDLQGAWLSTVMAWTHE